MPRRFRLTDRLNRIIGFASYLENLDGGLCGTFDTGRDFAEVESLFDRYEKHLGGLKTGSDHKDIYDELLALEPRLVCTSTGNEVRYHVAIVTKSPRGHSVVLLPHTKE